MSTVVLCQEALQNPVCEDKRTGVLTAVAIPRCPQTKVEESQKPSTGPLTEVIASREILHNANNCCRRVKYYNGASC